MLWNNNDRLNAHLTVVTELLHSNLDKSLLWSLTDYQERAQKARIDFADEPDFLERAMKRLDLWLQASLDRNKSLKASFEARVKELLRD